MTISLFRQAAELLKAKDGGTQLTEEELKLINTAIIPLMIHPTDGMTIGEGLEKLAQLVNGVE